MGQRFLIVTADDFGIGPATSQGVLDLARAGLLTATVLLVNSPYAEEAVQAWHQTGAALEVGWHPCLTLDRPVLPPEQVPSLIDREGRFCRLGQLLRRVALGQVRTAEVEAEFRAQWARFVELVGRPPRIVNGHHHIHVLPRIGAALRRVLADQEPLPYLRRVREPSRTFWQIGGARSKRAFLCALGRPAARHQEQAGFPGNDWLVGLGSPPPLGANRLLRWIGKVPGMVVELTCHPGYADPTLPGRDEVRSDCLHHRLTELRLLQGPAFPEACQKAGFTLVAPDAIDLVCPRRTYHAA